MRVGCPGECTKTCLVSIIRNRVDYANHVHPIGNHVFKDLKMLLGRAQYSLAYILGFTYSVLLFVMYLMNAPYVFHKQATNHARTQTTFQQADVASSVVARIGVFKITYAVKGFA